MLHPYRHLAVPLGIQIACGVAYGCIFPPLGWSALAWVVLVPALLAMRRVSASEAALLGGVLAFVGACVTVDWLYSAVVVYFQQSVVVGLGLFVAIVLVMVVPPYAAFAAWYRAGAERMGRALPLLAVGGPAGAMICNEALSPEIARARALAGAAYLVTLTNDTWIGSEKFAQISFDMARLRAVEQRRFLIRASTSGPSAIIAPDGSVVASSPLFDDATMRGEIELRPGLTLYARVGDLFTLSCVAASLLTLLLLRRRRTAA